MSEPLDALVRTRWTLVGGKGGVGKTTVAAALALLAAERGERVLVLSVDPAHSLADALGVEVGPEPAPVAGAGGLLAMELDADRERRAFLGRHGPDLARLLEHGTPLAPDEIERLLGLSLPGVDEVAAALRLADLAVASDLDRLVIDTAPTGHTLRLLRTPELLRGWTGLLGSLDEHRRAVVGALTSAPPPADLFVERLERDLDRFADLLADPAHTRMVLVTTPEPVVVEETLRYRAALRDAGVASGGVVVNRAAGADGAVLPMDAADIPVVRVPGLAEEPRGIDGLRRFAAAARAPEAPVPPRSPAPAPPAAAGSGDPREGGFGVPGGCDLYLVVGKGGVGKTSVASAVALRLARGGAGEVLLLSADPAGSLSEVWGVEVGAMPVSAPGAPGLRLLQLDAVGEWSALRRELEGEEHSGAGALPDRLLALPPPGIDELMALVRLVDLAEGGAYVAVVLDTAPTGHLLRLLEMPHLALGWIHEIMRLLLRYREAAGLGVVAERLLEAARGIRALRARLHDPARTSILVVSLPTTLALRETARLVDRMRELGFPAPALLVNRVDAHPPSPQQARVLREFRRLAAARVGTAAEREEGPRGAPALGEFAASWAAAAGAGSG